MSGKTTKQLDQDLIEHACGQLGKIARQRVREGLGPASAATAAIRATKELFPADWHLGVQGSDDEEAVEVWEVEHKRTIPCARITREPVPDRSLKLTATQLEVLDLLHRHTRRGPRSFTPTQRRALAKLVNLGLVMPTYDDQYQLTADGERVHRAAREDEEEESAW